MHRKVILCACAALLLLYSFVVPSSAMSLSDCTVTINRNGNLVDIYLQPYFSSGDVTFYKGDNSYIFTATNLTEGSNAPLCVQLYNNATGYSSSFSTYKGTLLLRFPQLTGITNTELMSRVDSTDYIIISLDFETFDNSVTNNIKPDLDTTLLGSSFAFTSQLGDLKRYTWFIDKDSSQLNSVISNLYAGNFSMYLPVSWKYDGKRSKTVTLYSSCLYLSNNPYGHDLVIPDADNTQVVVDGLENLEVAVNTAVSSGVEQLSSVVVQETTKITDSITEQTDTIINIGSDVDMSVPNRDELTSVQERQEAITNEIYDKINSGDVETVVSQKLSDLNTDSLNRSGFSWVGSLMQKTFDLGFGELIVMCLTLGVALFVIGRRMG